MAHAQTFSFPARGVRSLAWRGEDLVDWVGGGRAFAPNGAEKRAAVHYGYRFDAVCAAPGGRHAVIYERLGTKGLLLDHGYVLRELDRSYYCADDYEYPITLFNGPDGRLLLAHCPHHYNRIEIEDVESGEVLTASAMREPTDFFHSRLAASPGGKRLLSAGWVWHPRSVVALFDLNETLRDPRHLDNTEGFPLFQYEEGSACWLDDERVLIGGSADDESLGNEERFTPSLTARGLALVDVAAHASVAAFPMQEPPGTMYAVGETHVLSLYRHPKLIDLATGRRVEVWPELQSGTQDSSILGTNQPPPPMAYDPVSKRFAIANGDTITVITFT